jgi:DNA polymerase
VSPAAPDNPNRELESLLGFWAEAGVGYAYEDEAVDRMAEGRARLRAPAKAPKTSPPPSLAPRNVAPPQAAALAFAAEAARTAAAAAPDLEALKEAIAAFEGCPLRYSGARQAVFARGNPQAPVMIVGEGPGGEEDERGEPFVGRAGKLLDKMVEAAGLTGRVFITNTVFWRPPGNRTPSPEEQAACMPFVERAIELIQPKLLLLAGGASAKAMLRTNEGILSLRGKWSVWTSADGRLTVPALPSLHPAFLLRQPQAKKKAWADLLSLAVKLESLESLP